MSSKEGWKTSALEDVIDKFIDYRGKTPKKIDRGIPLVTAKVVKNGRIEPTQEFISEEEYENWMTRGFPKYGDVVLTTEAPLGEVAQLLTEEKVALAQRIITLRGRTGVIDNTFLKYSFLGSDMRERLDARATGTTVLGIKSSELKKVELDYPTIDIQQKIASILTSLDDKIELNRQMNQTLEATAQTLFREMCMPKGDELPQGWQKRKMHELLDTISNTYQREETEEVVFLNTSDILNGFILKKDYSSMISLPGQAKKKIERGDILYSEIRPKNRRYAYVDFNVDDYIVSTKLMVLRSKENVHTILLYTYLTLPEKIQLLQTQAEDRSGTFPQITFEQLGNLDIVLPDKSTVNKLTNTLVLLYKKIYHNQRVANELSLIRDTLLPKLLSGEIEV